MLTSSKKQKGRRLQKYIVSKILEYFPSLSSKDVQSRAMGSQGTDIVLSEAAFKMFPFCVEAKNKETNKALLKDWLQAIANTEDGEPLLVLGSNNSPTFAVIEFDMFMKMSKAYYGKN